MDDDRVQAIGTDSIPYQLCAVILRFLSHTDVCRLSISNRSWNEAIKEEACWDALLKRDFQPMEIRQLSTGHRLANKKALYCIAFRTRQNWRSGKSLPAVTLSRRTNRILVMNNDGLVAEVGTRDGSVRAWQPTSNAGACLTELELSSGPTEIGLEVPRTVIDCVLNDGTDAGDLELFCGGIGGAWIHTVRPASQRYVDFQAANGMAIHRVARVNTICSASASGADEDVIVWDANRPDAVLAKLVNQKLGDSVGLHMISQNLLSVVFREGSMFDIDLREPFSAPVGQTFCSGPASEHIQSSAMSSTRRVISTGRYCAEFDPRMFFSMARHRNLNLEDASVTWLVRNVSSMAIVNPETIVVGMLQGWEGPVKLLSIDGTSRRPLYSSERNYRVSRLEANSSSLAATCTDKNRLFVFSPLQV